MHPTKGVRGGENSPRSPLKEVEKFPPPPLQWALQRKTKVEPQTYRIDFHSRVKSVPRTFPVPVRARARTNREEKRPPRAPKKFLHDRTHRKEAERATKDQKTKG